MPAKLREGLTTGGVYDLGSGVPVVIGLEVVRSVRFRNIRDWTEVTNHWVIIVVVILTVRFPESFGDWRPRFIWR